jgi:hypothetical protein
MGINPCGAFMPEQIAHGDIRWTQFRWPVLVSTLRGGYYDRDGERAVIKQIREHGRINADAYGTGWNDGYGWFCETEWRDENWLKLDKYFAANPIAGGRSQQQYQKYKIERAQMDAARKAALDAWLKEKAEAKRAARAFKIRAEQRRAEGEKRWREEQAAWDRIAKQNEAIARRRQKQKVVEYIGEPPPNTDWHQVLYYRRDLGHYTWKTLKDACRIAIVDHKQEFMPEIMAFLNLPDSFYDGVLAACTELVNDGKLVRLR